jgi:hypothetical protein
MTTAASPQLSPHDKIRAAEDLPGVPKGTKGKVLVVSGVDWIRYRVLFDNGVERGMLNADQLALR